MITYTSYTKQHFERITMFIRCKEKEFKELCLLLNDKKSLDNMTKDDLIITSLNDGKIDFYIALSSTYGDYDPLYKYSYVDRESFENSCRLYKGFGEDAKYANPFLNTQEWVVHGCVNSISFKEYTNTLEEEIS